MNATYLVILFSDALHLLLLLTHTLRKLVSLVKLCESVPRNFGVQFEKPLRKIVLKVNKTKL